MLQIRSSQNPSNCFYHSHNLLIRNREAARQIKPSARDSFSVRISFAREQSHSPKHRLLVHRPEEWTRADAEISQSISCFIRSEKTVTSKTAPNYPFVFLA